jgi:hypothetical protein
MLALSSHIPRWVPVFLLSSPILPDLDQRVRCCLITPDADTDDGSDLNPHRHSILCSFRSAAPLAPHPCLLSTHLPLTSPPLLRLRPNLPL